MRGSLELSRPRCLKVSVVEDGCLDAESQATSENLSGREYSALFSGVVIQSWHAHCQSSKTKPGTRLNSEVLCVTTIRPLLSAMPEIIRS